MENSNSGNIVSIEPSSIQHVQEIVVFDPEADIARAKKAAGALIKVIDMTKPLVMNGKRYLYFEHWQTIGKFFNYTVGTEWTHQTASGWEARAVVYDRNGNIIGAGEASCDGDERNWKGKPDFQLRSMAQTRAQSKALRGLLGFIAVLAGVEATPAEELDGQEKTSPRGSNSATALTQKQQALIDNLIQQKQASVEMATQAGFPSLKPTTKQGAARLIEWLLTLPSVPNGTVSVEDIPFD